MSRQLLALASVMAAAAAAAFPSADGLSSTILVSNISPLVDESTLEELFGECGTIVNLPLQILSVGAARCCEITFETVAQAQAAALLNGVAVGTPLEIKIKAAAPPAPEMPLSAGASVGANELVAELRQKVSNILGGAAPAVAPGGPVVAPGAMALQSIARPGFSASGFDLAAAVASQPSQPPIRISAAVPTGGPVVSPEQMEEVRRTVYVGNLSPLVTLNELRDFFSQAGRVTYTKIADRTSGRSGNFAFVEFATMPESDLAAIRLNGQYLRGQAIKVSKAINPIIKDQSTTQAQVPRELKVQEAMRKVQAAQERLRRKLSQQPQRASSRPRSRDRSRDRRSRSPSRSRDRRHRRSHSRERRRSRSRSRGGRSSWHERRRSRSRSPQGSSSSRRESHSSRSDRDRDRERRHRRSRSRSRGDRSHRRAEDTAADAKPEANGRQEPEDAVSASASEVEEEPEDKIVERVKKGRGHALQSSRYRE